jgi:uncharacterized protein
VTAATRSPGRAALALSSALALALTLLPPTTSSAAAQDASASDLEGVAISQTANVGPAGSNDNFIELTNFGAETADLEGWEVYRCFGSGNLSGSPQVPAFTDLKLVPGGTVIIAYEGYTGPDTPYLYGGNNGLANSGFGVLVQDADGNVVDSMGAYGSGGPSASPCVQGDALANSLSNSDANAFVRVDGSGDNASDYEVAPRSFDVAGPLNVLTNPSFEASGLVGAPPADWASTSFENEGTPFGQTDVSVRSLDGTFPPPGPLPDGDFAVQVFWRSSGATGIKGYGIEQTAEGFLTDETIDETNVAGLAYAIAETSQVNPASTTWSGAIAEVEISTPEGVELVRYYHPSSVGSGAPENGEGVNYISAEPLVRGEWIQADQDLATDLTEIAEEFTVTAVRLAALHERTNTDNFTNQTIYLDNAALTAEVEIEDTPPPPAECTPNADITPIHAVQGAGSSSPLAGQTVTVDAVVTLVEPNIGGLFLQEAPDDIDDDPLTSEGLFISTSSIPDGVEADVTVQATGRIEEFFGRTQMNTSGTQIAVCADVGPISIEPVELPLPSSPAEREPFESMLVTASELVVSGTFRAWEFGELTTGFQGELASATEVATPGPEAEQAAEEIKAREVILDNRRVGSLRDRSIWDEDPQRRLGDVIPEVSGVLDFNFGDFKIQYTEFPEFELFGAPEVPRLEQGNDIAAFNVLNYFNEFGSSSRLRGAQNEARFELQTAKIVETILELDATVLGLIELQNDYRDEFDGDPETEPSVATLVNFLNEAAGEDRYDYVRMPIDQLATEGLNGGGVGTDAIANGIIYQPARATQIGEAATFDIDAGLSGDDRKNRWPFAASFDIDGQLSTVAVNHFKSKGSGCTNVIGPDFGLGEDVELDFVANCDLTRQYAANQLVEWIDTDPTEADTDKVFLVGDFNSYAQEAPIQVMKDAGYVNTVEELAEGAFTYKFSGRVGTLDYIMASEAAAEIVDDAAVWQVNSRASYVDLYDVADDRTQDDLTKGSSDHDPLVVSLLGVDDEQPEPASPTDKDECKDGGWRVFTDPSFRNQGACVSFVASGELRGPAAASGKGDTKRR